MKTVTFVTHYFKDEIKISLTDDKYNKLMHNKFKEPIYLYRMDDYRVRYGFTPRYLSVCQIKKLNNFLLGTEYFDNIF